MKAGHACCATRCADLLFAWLRMAVGSVCILAAGVSHAEVIEPDAVLTATVPLLVFDTLVISGTLLVANEPSTPGGGALRCVVVTNGDFVLAAGGVISQSFDIAQVSSNGANGAIGSAADGGPGQPGLGYGRGGNGGRAYWGTHSGGNGGAGGSVGGAGGSGGGGGDSPGMSESAGGAGGGGGNGGAGACGFTVMVVNATVGGTIVVNDGGNVWLHGTDGGAGGNGGAGGLGGAYWLPHDGVIGLPGGAGGGGGAGGSGGAGGILQMICSNGCIVSGDWTGWCDGKNGGSGGTGGSGGPGGPGDHDDGPDGPGGSGGAGGSGGDGGTILAIAQLIVHNGMTAQWSTVTAMTNNGFGGSGGLGGSGGASGAVGQTGRAGQAIIALLDDTEAPVCFGTPIVVPSNDVVWSLGEEVLMVFSPTNFSDNITAPDSLRHTIHIVHADDVHGAPLAQIRDGQLPNRVPHDHVVFTPPIEMLGRTSCVRFITSDIAGNVATSMFVTPRLMVVYRPLEAEFTLSPLTGYSPLTVQFSDKTKNGAQYWKWDFNGDGITDSTNRNPSYVYHNPGRYTVRLGVSNWYGTNMTASSMCIGTNIVQAYAGADTPFLAITTAPPAFINYYMTCYQLAGINNVHVQGGLWWSNTGSGAVGHINRSTTAWTCTITGLVEGANVIRVCGTNVMTIVASDSITLNRGYERDLPLLEPPGTNVVREHQVLLRQLAGRTNIVSVFCDTGQIHGASYFDGDTRRFSCIPAFGTAGATWRVGFTSVNQYSIETQALVIIVGSPAQGIVPTKPLRYQDADGDTLDIKYSCTKNNDAVVLFDGQNLMVSNTAAKGKLRFAIRHNKKTGGDGSFDLREVAADNDGALVKLAGNVAHVNMPACRLGTLTFSSKDSAVSNIAIAAAKTINAGKATVMGVVAISNGFDTMTVGTAMGARIMVGVAAEANPSNTPAQAGFKTIKAATMTATLVTGRDTQKDTKILAPKIKVRSARSSTFYHTDTNNVVAVRPITSQ